MNTDAREAPSQSVSGGLTGLQPWFRGFGRTRLALLVNGSMGPVRDPGNGEPFELAKGSPTTPYLVEWRRHGSTAAVA